MTTPSSDFLSEMKWRGLVHQCTDEPALASHLHSGTRRAYVGFDPTADSLTIGNLVGIMALTRFQMAGHSPVAVMGGGTGLIGDPSGKSAERQLRTKEEIAENVRQIETIFDRVWRNSAEIRGVDLKPPTIVNNIDWLGKLSYLDALRDIGKHFSVNMMIQKDSVRERLHNRDQGISYTEFSYMILQAYDFAYLNGATTQSDNPNKKTPTTLQMGGSDQYGNILVGLDLIKSHYGSLADRLDQQNTKLFWDWAESLPGGMELKKRFDAAIWRPLMLTPQEPAESLDTVTAELTQFLEEHASRSTAEGVETPLARISVQAYLKDYFLSLGSSAFGLTWPLVTKADGTKFGKTESGAIWLTARSGPKDISPARTSPYAYYQFWLNAADADVIRFMKIYTHLTREEITALEASHAADPGKRDAHRALARGATHILHGKHEMEQAEAAGKALFSGDVAGLSLETLGEVFASVPSSNHDKSSLAGEGMSIVELLAQTSLAKSKSEARQFVTEGSVSINGAKAGLETRVSTSTLLHGSMIALRRGKKSWHVTRWS